MIDFKSNIKSSYTNSLKRYSIFKNSSLTISVVIASLLITTIIILAFTYINKLKSLLHEENTLHFSEVSTQSIKSIQNKVNGEMNLLKSLSLNISESEEINLDKLLPLLDKESSQNKLKRMGVILPNGIAYTSDGYINNFYDRTNFKNSLNGESIISDVLTDKIDGENIIVYSTPIYINNKIKAVLFATHSIKIYSEILSLSTFKGEGFSLISKDNGKIMVNHKTYNMYSDERGFIDISINDTVKHKTSFNTMKLNMEKDKSGIIEYNFLGREVYMSYDPIHINDWYLISVVPKDVFTKKSNDIEKITYLASGIIVIIIILLLIYTSISESKNKKALATLAYIDPLTGFSNYAKFKIDSEFLLKKSKNNYAYISLDVYKFKYINHIFGDLECNNILQSIANIIKETISSDELFCRKDDDCYSILLKYETQNDIINKINILNNRFSNINNSSNTKHSININYGIYKISNKKMPINSINNRADFALSTAKVNHAGSLAFYNNNLREKIIEESYIESIMNASLENREFQVYLQGKYNIDPLKISGAEALIRWNNPDKGILFPDKFIPLFEKNGFIVNLDIYVFEEVCKTLRSWIDRGIKPIPIAVNQSKINLYNSSFIDDLQIIINKYNIPANLIEIEITESAVFDDTDYLIKIMKQLKEVGFLLSMDDFGSGYSSLNLLKDLPVDILKLDREFFSTSINTDRGKMVISSIVSMAKSLNLQVISEGIETNDQYNFLKSINCDMVQGYLFSRPIPIKDFEENYLSS